VDRVFRVAVYKRTGLLILLCAIFTIALEVLHAVAPQVEIEVDGIVGWKHPLLILLIGVISSFFSAIWWTFWSPPGKPR
jgi:hypothetical protein